MDPELTLERACELEQAEQDKEENHEGTWASLDAMQRQLVLLFANDPLAKPFSKAGLTRLSKELGVLSLEATSVQYALRGLAHKNVVWKSARGVYTFESVAFERWAKTLAPAIP